MIKVLIVDDDENNRDVMFDALESNDYELFLAEDGHDALRKVDADLPDVILLDIMMPGLDGIETLQRLKANEKTKHVPVIMVTALSMESQVAMCLDEGAVDHVTKPFSNVVLRARVRAAVRAKATKGLAADSTAPVQKRGKVIVFLGSKGGVGNTTIAINTAVAMCQQGKRVNACELTCGYGGAALQLGVTSELTIAQLVEGEGSRISPRDVKERLTKHPCGLQVLLGPKQADDTLAISSDQAEAVVNSLVESADFTIIDMPCHLTPYTQAVVRLADSVVMVVELEPSSLASAQMLLRQLNSWGVGGKSLGVVANSRAILGSPINLKDVRASIECELIGMIPPNPDECITALKQKTPVVLFRSDSPVSGAIKALAGRLVAEQVAALVI